MKFNKNSYGNTIFSIVSSTIKSMLKKINISFTTTADDRPVIKFTNVNNDINYIDINAITKNHLDISASSQLDVLNPNPSMLLNDLDYKRCLEQLPNNVSLSTHRPYGAYRSLAVKGQQLIILDTPIVMPKYKKYRASIDVATTLINGDIDEDKSVIFYFGYIAYDGCHLSTDSRNFNRVLNKNLGYMINPKHVRFIGTDENDVNTAYKYILTREFKQGDEYFYFRTDDINNWYIKLVNGVADIDYQIMKFYRKITDSVYAYVSKSDITYTNLGYTRDIFNTIQEQDTTKDADDPLRYFVPTGNTVEGQTEYKAKIDVAEHNKVWDGKYNYYPVGSILLQSINKTGTFQYFIANQKVIANNKFSNFESPWIDFSDKTGRNDSNNSYILDTRYVLPLLLTNYGAKDSDGNTLDTRDFISYFANIALEYKNIE